MPDLDKENSHTLYKHQISPIKNKLDNKKQQVSVKISPQLQEADTVQL